MSDSDSLSAAVVRPPTYPTYHDVAGRHDWITTFTGLVFFPLNPRPQDIRIEDIAHALSLLCRFSGHTREFYSVAQHSVVVSQICGPQGLWGLLHDASEAYLCDIVRPLKHQPELAGYRSVEHLVQLAVCVTFGLDLDEPDLVKQADRLVLRSEKRDLMTMPAGWVAGDRPTLPYPIRPMTARQAERAFLDRFRELTETRA